MPLAPPHPGPARDWPIPPMDHAAGGKDTAFTWAMGRLILQRMGARETIRQITADPRMPAYCTVFQWVKVVPEFGEAYGEMRRALARATLQEQAQRRAAVREARDAARIAAGKPVRTWVAGRRCSYDPAVARRFCAAIEDGAAASALVGRPGMPTGKQLSGWRRRRPDFRAMYVEACRRRAVGLWCERDLVIDRAIDQGPAFDRRQGSAEIAAIEGRMGRLTPKLYRA
jgi:hypothetical protein